MSRPITGKTFSRRDVLFSLLGRWQRSDSPRQPIGFDAQSREIEACLAENDLEEAARLLEEVLAKSPDHIQAMQKLAYCRLKLGRPQEAVDLLRQVRSLKPQDNFAALYLGLSLCRLGSLEEAMKTWQGYFNVDQPVIQRAVNLQLALYEMDGPTSAEDIAAAVEEAIEEQERLDTNKSWR